MPSSDERKTLDMSGPMMALARAIRPTALRTGDRDLMVAADRLEDEATRAATKAGKIGPES